MTQRWINRSVTNVNKRLNAISPIKKKGALLGSDGRFRCTHSNAPLRDALQDDIF